MKLCRDLSVKFSSKGCALHDLRMTLIKETNLRVFKFIAREPATSGMSQDATCLEPLARECGPELIVGGRSTGGESRAGECFPLSAGEPEVLSLQNTNHVSCSRRKKREWLAKNLLTKDGLSEIYKRPCLDVLDIHILDHPISG